MTTDVPITRPDLGPLEAEAAARVVRSGWVAQGPEVVAFEAETAAFVGAAGAVAVCNGTAALELALRALGIGPGDDVLTVSHSFIATVNCVMAVGARPVLVDIEPRTLGMDPARLEAAVTPRARAVICVHQLGIPCDLPGVLAVAQRHSLPVVEDAACALGSEVFLDGKWEQLGRPRGALACFSFHPRKIVTTGEGGMVTAADPALLEHVRRLRQHGAGPSQAAGGGLVFPSFVEPGFNARLDDIGAAIGRTQVARLAESIAARRRIAARYAQALDGHPVLAPPEEPAGTRCNWQSYPARLRPGAGVDQHTVLRWFAARRIACQRGVANAHQEPAYADHRRFGCGPDPCPGAASGSPCTRLAVSEAMRDGTVLLPIFQTMTDAERDTVLQALDDLRHG